MAAFGHPFIGGGGPPQEVDPITSFFDMARQRVLSSDWSSVFNDLLTQNTAMQPPTPTALPPSINSFGQLGSVFASTLAEQLGARGSMAANEERLAAHEAGRRRIQEQNTARLDEFNQNKAMRELQIRMKINEARAEQFKQLGDLNEYEARLKAQAAMRKEEIRMREEAKSRLMKEADAQILGRIDAAAKAKGNEARKTINFRETLKKTLGDDKLKASDALKLWGRMQQQQIFARDGITGEYLLTPEQQEKKSEEVYKEYLERMAEEALPTGQEPQGDPFDQFINSFFTE